MYVQTTCELRQSSNSCHKLLKTVPKKEKSPLKFFLMRLVGVYKRKIEGTDNLFMTSAAKRPFTGTSPYTNTYTHSHSLTSLQQTQAHVFVITLAESSHHQTQYQTTHQHKCLAHKVTSLLKIRNYSPKTRFGTSAEQC
jgi:hypothetical protein